MEATPGFVLEAGRECQRAFAGVGGAGGLGGLDSWRRGAPLLHRGSSGEIASPTVGVVIDNESSPQDIPGRSGERVQGEAVEREREEAVERLLQWGLVAVRAAVGLAICSRTSLRSFLRSLI